MIVRILGEGQYRLADAELELLNALDNDVEAAAKAGDEDWLRRALSRLLEEVRTRGTLLDDDLLLDSDVIVPDEDVSLEQIQGWIGEGEAFDGLLPS